MISHIQALNTAHAKTLQQLSAKVDAVNAIWERQDGLIKALRAELKASEEKNEQLRVKVEVEKEAAKTRAERALELATTPTSSPSSRRSINLSMTTTPATPSAAMTPKKKGGTYSSQRHKRCTCSTTLTSTAVSVCSPSFHRKRRLSVASATSLTPAAATTSSTSTTSTTTTTTATTTTMMTTRGDTGGTEMACATGQVLVQAKKVKRNTLGC